MSEKEILSYVLNCSQDLAKSIDSSVVKSPNFLENGHDVAVVNNTLISTDSLVIDVDFNLAYTSFYSIGFKAIQSAISDIYAAGGKPVGCLVSIIADLDNLKRDLAELYRGIGDSLKLCNALLLGGDTSGASKELGLSLCITAVGIPSTYGSKSLSRTVPSGDWDLYVSSPIGLSLLGFCLINELADFRAKKLDITTKPSNEQFPINEWVKCMKLRECEQLVRNCLEVFLRPHACTNPDAGNVVAATDISDGLITDLDKFCVPMDKSIYLNLSILKERIAKYEKIAAYFGLSLDELILYSGEEYKHLVVAPKTTKEKSLLKSYLKIGEIASDSTLTPLETWRQNKQAFNHGSNNIYSRFTKTIKHR